MNIQILYGIPGKYVDVTVLASIKCPRDGENIIIPAGDHARACMFGDHLPCVLKHICIMKDDQPEIFDDKNEVRIPTASLPSEIDKETLRQADIQSRGKAEHFLSYLHKRLTLDRGSFSEEYPEQRLTVKFIPSDAIVLEIGGNIGRNTLVIASILSDSRNLLTLETNKVDAEILRSNGRNNNLNFQVINAALSKKRLFQQSWTCVPFDTDPGPGSPWTEVSTITWDQLNEEKQMAVPFDTLVADCEGAVYYILQDFPTILDNISLILIENDFCDITNKRFVDRIFKEKGFNCIYSERGGWGPCARFFYQAWKK